MKKIHFSIVLLLSLFSCTVFNKNVLTNRYLLKDKYLMGEIDFTSKDSFSLYINRDLFYKESNGTYYIDGDIVFLTSEWNLDTFLLDCHKIDTLKSIRVAIKDFNDIPIEGKVILNNQFEFHTKNGEVFIEMLDYQELMILTFNYLEKELDTIKVVNNSCNSFVVKRLNTFNYYNYIFLSKAPFQLRNDKLIDLSRSLTKDKRLKFQSNYPPR